MALNGLDVLAADIQNTYLNAPMEEKVWFRAGPEWGAHTGNSFDSTGFVWSKKFQPCMVNPLCSNPHANWLQIKFCRSGCMV